jgi:hypothetical protein
METNKKTYICTGTNNNGKKCSNKLSSESSLDYHERKCHVHAFNWEEGICYECHEQCNPCSQVCGRCARRMTMQLMGWSN